MAIGERTPIALLDAAAAARMAVGEAVTNIASAADPRNRQIKLSANWMAPAGHPERTRRSTMPSGRSGMEICPALGIAVPVGKDSMSMRTVWEDEAGRAQRHRADLADRVGLRAGARHCAPP